MPRTTTTHKNRQGVGGDPKKSQGRPDAGARKAARKARALEAVAKQFAPTVLPPDRIATMSTAELLATLDALVPVETFFLSRSLDPRPVAPQPEGPGLTIVHRHWPHGVDPLADQYPKERLVSQLAPQSPEDQPPPADSGGLEEERVIRAPEEDQPPKTSPVGSAPGISRRESRPPGWMSQ